MLAKTITRPFFMLWLRVRFYGRENLPKNGGYILCCNHNSNFDPILLTWPLNRMICYMAKEQLFRPHIGWLIRALGAFPVQRGSGDTSALDTAADMLKKGHILGLFPEGHRHPVGQPGRAKSGAALIAKATGADVLPCAIHYTKNHHFGSRVSISIGQLIPNAELFEGEEGPRQIKRASRKMWDATLSLLQQRHGLLPEPKTPAALKQGESES